MTYTLSILPLLVVFGVVLAVTVATIAGVSAGFLARNRKVRVARHESVPTYYGHLLLGH